MKADAIRIVNYEPWHVDRVIIQPGQKLDLEMARSEAAALKYSGVAWSAFRGEDCIAMIGVIQQARGPANTRYAAWALIGRTGSVAFVALHRRVRNWLRAQKGPVHIEAHVREDFVNGHRWIDMLGYEYRATRPQYGPDGEAYALYEFIVPEGDTGAAVMDRHRSMYIDPHQRKAAAE